VLVLAGCSSPTPIPTPTPIPPTPTPTPPKAISLFMEKEGMTQEQAIEALRVLNSFGVEDISRLDFDKVDVPGNWYFTDFQGFPDARIYISNDKLIKKATDNSGDMYFYNFFKNGVEENVKDFILYDNEKESFKKASLEFVPLGLKAPSTAKFPDISDPSWKVARYGDYVQVESWVDAENSFSAMLRNDFLIQIDYTTKEMLFLSIEGKWVYGERQHWRNN